MSRIYLLAVVNCDGCDVEGQMRLPIKDCAVEPIIEVGKYDAPEGWDVTYDYQFKHTYCPECARKNW